MAENVKVAVRVRPFNKREKERGAKICIEMEGQRTTIIDVTGEHAPKDFAFDYRSALDCTVPPNLHPNPKPSRLTRNVQLLVA